MDALRIFVGIDGGGSKTTAVAVDESGCFLAKYVGSSINFYSIGMEQARQNMSDILNEISLKLNVKTFTCVFIGMSALFDEASEEDVRAFSDGIISADYVYMNSDLHVAMAGLLEKGECAMAISGTGSMVIARNSNGELLQSGGWGYILGDEGSGYAIAISGIKRGIRSFEKILPPSLLSDALMQYYNVDDLYKLVDIFYDPPMPRNEIAKFTKAVYACALKGDTASLEIIRFEAEEFAANAVSLLLQLKNDATIGVYGGVFEHNEIFRDAFSQEVHKHCPEVTVKLLEFPPEIGAVFCGFEKLGIELTENILENIKNTYLKEK